MNIKFLDRITGWLDVVFNWFGKWRRKRETKHISDSVNGGDSRAVDDILSDVEKKRKDRADR